MEVELESRSSTNANTVAVTKITMERRWRVEKKGGVFACFGVDQKSRVRRKNAFGGIL